jgi:hypothetical protein
MKNNEIKVEGNILGIFSNLMIFLGLLKFFYTYLFNRSERLILDFQILSLSQAKC